jgi:hypothetical protein
VSNSPKLKFPIQLQCTCLDSPVFANLSKVISDSPTVLDFTSYSPPTTVHAEIVFSPLEWKVVLAWIAASPNGWIHIYGRTRIGDIMGRLRDRSIERSCLLPSHPLCRLVRTTDLSEDANPHGALAGVGMIMYMLGEVRFLEALCRIGHAVRLLLFLLYSFAYRFFLNRSCPLRFIPLLPPCLRLRRRSLHGCKMCSE